jgi:hypothetical protein
MGVDRAILLGRIKMQLRGLCWIGTLRARGREEDQRRPGRGQSWKRHRERTDVEGGEVVGSGQK